MFTSPTYGKLNIQDIPEKIRIFFEKHEHYDAPVKIIVGTDSQNFDQTKVVSVIAVICEGHGGIFFYEVTRKPIIKDVRTKLHEETNDSLQVAELTACRSQNSWSGSWRVRRGTKRCT